MWFFKADYCFDKVTDITLQQLKALGIKALFLDIDNTIKKYGAAEPEKKVIKWLDEMKKNGIKIILCSNNYKRNVMPVANSLGLPYVSMCLKPSPFGYFRAMRIAKEKRKNILICGDQLFTDIMGARISFYRCALIEPIDVSNEGATVKFRRKILNGQREKNLRFKKN